MTPARKFAGLALIVLGPFWASAAAFMLGTSLPYVFGAACAGLGLAILVSRTGTLGNLVAAALAGILTYLVLEWSAA
ncbi:hypothetical protein [Pontivivens insulae]|uniref:Uncharacterized protein n=1 Tax=Pontivivens insulae TaxID=1639689 RepID=A0A2R8AFL4_9RHOB|nr:hypothetical protein [Pontivivens insulae]RED12276.1 hypothetical protein DFR53_2994 [Pontivivens insulae]SPF31033.1 hypothetical protein POI8812_03383 [Pontivivens insulae]